MDKLKQFLKKYWIGFVIIVGSILLDGITKLIVIKNIELHQDIVIIDKFFSLTYTINNGAGWSMMSGKTGLLILITILALGLFVWLMKDFDIKKHFFYSLGISLMLGGTIGNFIERIFKGGVTDFLSFIIPIVNYNFPVFNVADMCLVIGAFALIISLVFTKEDVFEIKKKNPLSNQSDALEDESTDSTNENKNNGENL